MTRLTGEELRKVRLAEYKVRTERVARGFRYLLYALVALLLAAGLVVCFTGR